MKPVSWPIITFIFLFCSLKITCQELSQTKWKTTFNNSEIIVEFRLDSLNLIIGNEQLEISTFTTYQDTLELIDHPNSVCSDTIIGLYQFSIVDNSMFVELISDSCANRRMFFEDRTLFRCIETHTIEHSITKPLVYPNPNISKTYFIKNDEGYNYDYVLFNSLGQVIQNGKVKKLLDVHVDEKLIYLQLRYLDRSYMYKLLRIQ